MDGLLRIANAGCGQDVGGDVLNGAVQGSYLVSGHVRSGDLVQIRYEISEAALDFTRTRARHRASPFHIRCAFIAQASALQKLSVSGSRSSGALPFSQVRPSGFKPRPATPTRRRPIGSSLVQAIEMGIDLTGRFEPSPPSDMALGASAWLPAPNIPVEVRQERRPLAFAERFGVSPSRSAGDHWRSIHDRGANAPDRLPPRRS